MNATGYSAT